MIEGVEPLRAEFDSLALSDPERLERGKIEVDQTRPSENISSGIAEWNVHTAAKSVRYRCREREA